MITDNAGNRIEEIKERIFLVYSSGQENPILVKADQLGARDQFIYLHLNGSTVGCFPSNICFVVEKQQ